MHSPASARRITRWFASGGPRTTPPNCPGEATSGPAQSAEQRVCLLASRIAEIAVRRSTRKNEMTREQVIEILQSNLHQRLLVTFSDGVIQLVSIISVDSEGFVHRGTRGDKQMYWTRFESVKFIDSDNSN